MIESVESEDNKIPKQSVSLKLIDSVVDADSCSDCSEDLLKTLNNVHQQKINTLNQQNNKISKDSVKVNTSVPTIVKGKPVITNTNSTKDAENIIKNLLKNHKKH